MRAKLDGEPLELWQSHQVLAGQVLKMTAAISGARAYIAIAGGIDNKIVLGSRSTFSKAGVGGIDGGALNLILGQWLSSAQQPETATSDSMLKPKLVALIDITAAEKLVADIGIEAYQDIAEMFAQECRKGIKAINTDYNDLNFDDVAKACHAILSGARSLGAEQLGQHLKSLELVSITASTSEMNMLIATLGSLTDESLTALDDYANSLTT
jgi:HPt (histidine-containing phosphotransfer) domain-containing protein